MVGVRVAPLCLGEGGADPEEAGERSGEIEVVAKGEMVACGGNSLVDTGEIGAASPTTVDVEIVVVVDFVEGGMAAKVC